MSKSIILKGLICAGSIGLASAALLSSVEAAFPGENGMIAFTSNRDGNNEIYIMNTDGSGQTNLSNNSAQDSDAAWSPNGKKIVFTSNRDGNDEVYLMNADGTGQVNISNSPTTNDQNPAWSPDGTKIIFSRSAGPRSGAIFEMNADGSSQTQLTFELALSFPADFGPAYSTDGTVIYFTRSLSNSNQEIYSMNADGSGLAAVTSNGVISRFPNSKPDGTKVVFDRGPAGSDDIYLMNPDGTGQTNITNSGGQINGSPAFAPDGNKIVFDSFRTGEGDVFVMNEDGSGQINLTNNPARDTQADWGVVPVAACGEIEDEDFGSYEGITCGSTGTVNVFNQTELDAYLVDYAFDGSKIRNVNVKFNPVGDIDIRTPCKVTVSGENGNRNIAADSLFVFGREGASVASDVTITTAGETTLVSVLDDAGFSDGADVTSSSVCVQAEKYAKIGLHSTVEADTVDVVSTGDFSSSDATIRQGSDISADSVLVEASRGATIGLNATVASGELVVRSTGDNSGSLAIFKQGSDITVDSLSLISGNKATVGVSVSVTVGGDFEMNAQSPSKCTIKASASISAGSTSGNCFP